MQSTGRVISKSIVGVTKDENIGIDGNIEGQKYGNIGGNIGEISILIKFWKKLWKFIKKYEIFNKTLKYAYLLNVLSIQ